MGKITRISTPVSAYTADNPEDGHWWHALDAIGRCLFEKKSPLFGKQTAETTDSQALKNKRCIRCRPSKSEVEQWVPKDGSGAILKIPKQPINPDVWGTFGQQSDIHLDAQAALEKGKIEKIIEEGKQTAYGPTDPIRAKNLDFNAEGSKKCN